MARAELISSQKSANEANIYYLQVIILCRTITDLSGNSLAPHCMQLASEMEAGGCSSMLSITDRTIL